MNLNEARALLYPLFRNHPTWGRAIRVPSGGVPVWLGTLATRLAVLLDDEPIEFFGGHCGYVQAEEGFGDVVIYTSRRLILARVTLDGGTTQIAVSTISRSALTSVEVMDGGTDMFVERVLVEWPGLVRLRAKYGDVTVDVPGSAIEDDQLAAFYQFVPTLLADLESHHGASR